MASNDDADDSMVITIAAGRIEGAICCLVIPNALLLEWRKTTESVCYISSVNEYIIDGSIVLNPESVSLERKISHIAVQVANLFRKSKGRKKYEVLNGSTQLNVLQGECVSALQLWKTEQAESMDDYVAVTDELIENLVRDVEEMEQELSWLHALENRGKMVDEVSTRHRKRKLEVVRDNAVKALSFAESYGLILDTLTLRTSSEECVQIQLSEDTVAQAELEGTEVCKVLYLLDRYGVSDAFYQELSMQFERLPRLHKVKATRTELNETVELIRIPGYDGCYRHVEMAVCEEISRLVSISYLILHVYYPVGLMI